MTLPPTPLDQGWFKSTRSSDNANCVEVRFTGDTVGVRDSKDRNGPTLAFDDTTWTTFVHTLKTEAPRP
ncbi:MULTISPECIES: DUF397 domain-containing protein [Micromonospora]|uniref:DUF397 domain-containing protein n=1 Tax=Micromonospora yangpuensis TaxID=683228 RepID=A0A1C6UC62_9ACTN|nr:DUF397 domain-containing protein [Micromonospora yangpuensis]GGM29618.1 hypothetical protein GCM10012279_55430 [Micromonospora yangpuensis]SCL51558.1 protein of unknown function [Micromonospora yangpuensis]